MLIIEDRDAMAGMICNILEKRGVETKVVSDTEIGLQEYGSGTYDVVILDTAVDDLGGMQFVTGITPEYSQRENHKGRRINAACNTGVIVIRAVSERVPSDCPCVKAELVRPFTSRQLEEAVAVALSEEGTNFITAYDRDNAVADPLAELARIGITYGESYVFFEKNNDFMQEVMRIFAKAGYDMLIVTSSRPKVARDRFGLDKDAEVFTLTGNDYKLGSMIEQMTSFIGRAEHPVIALDNLDDIIEHSSIDRTVTAISEILPAKRKKGFTLLTSVDGELLTKNIRNILTDIMVEYKKKG